MSSDISLPNLEKRFLPPENWQSHNFTNTETKHCIHYNFIKHDDDNSKANLIILPGLSEFGEKYIETACFFYELGYNVYIIDWAYQGRSTRFRENSHKRHSDGYDSDISDLHYLVTNIVKMGQPVHMLAHSMGGNIGLRYLLKHQNTFKSASLSAPMLGILDLKHREKLVGSILSLLKTKYTAYVPGGKNWRESTRPNNRKDIFSSDHIRRKIHNAWCLSNPSLQVGNPTLGWIYHSLVSINILKDKKKLRKIKTPILLAYAESEEIVDNAAIKRKSKTLPNAKLLELKNSKHEILVEKDQVRDVFLEETVKIFNQ